MSLIQRAALFPSKRAPADEMQLWRYLTARRAVFLRALHGLHLAIADAVTEINGEADQKLDEHNLLGKPRKRIDKIERRDDPEDRNDGNEERAEPQLHLRSAAPQNPDTGADDREGEQGPHIGELAEAAHRKQRGQAGRDNTARL